MKIWTLDFETYWDSEYTLSKLTTDGYILDPRFEVQGLAVRPPDGTMLYFTPAFIPRVLASIPWSEVGVLAHNTAFDGFILQHHYKTPRPRLWLDTLSMARMVLPPNKRASLAAVAEYFELPPKGNELVKTRGKREHQFTGTERAELAKYAKHDAWLCWEILQRLLPGFPAVELALIDQTLRMFLEPALHLDQQRLRAFLAETQERKARLVAATGLGSRDALMSNEQFAEALELLGVDAPMKISPTTGKLTMALSKRDPGFKELLDHDDERVVALVEARLEVKSTGDETRTKRLLSVAEANRPWPVLLNFAGAKQTNRWSGGNKQNPQNLRRGGALREAIVAPPGHVVVVVDSSQIEARCNAAEAGQMDLVQAFANKQDVYAGLAATIYGFAVNKKEHPLQRQVGKTGILGLGYGMGTEKFQLALKTDPIMPIELDALMCERVVDTYRRVKYPRIPQWWRTAEYAIRLVAEGARKNFGWFETCAEGFRMPGGFVIRYDGLRTGEYKGKQGWWYSKYGKLHSIYGAKAVENITQHIARDIVAKQLLQIMRREVVAEFGHRLVLMSHDELVFVVPEAKGPALLDHALGVMHQAPTWTPIPVPVAAEGNIGRRYSDAK